MMFLGSPLFSCCLGTSASGWACGLILHAPFVQKWRLWGGPPHFTWARVGRQRGLGLLRRLPFAPCCAYWFAGGPPTADCRKGPQVTACDAGFLVKEGYPVHS